MMLEYVPVERKGILAPQNINHNDDAFKVLDSFQRLGKLIFSERKQFSLRPTIIQL